MRKLKPSQSVQSLSRVRLFLTPWTAAREAFPSITNSWSLRNHLESFKHHLRPGSHCRFRISGAGSARRLHTNWTPRLTLS